MLVTLGSNQSLGANSTITLPYACRSVQKIFIKVDDSTGSTAIEHNVTVQLGSRTILNGCSAYGLYGFSGLAGGSDRSGAEVFYAIDLGSHNLLDSENLYVTVRSGTNALDAVDVSALVDEPVNELPIRYTEYSDNVFTAENSLCAISWASNASAVDEDASNIEIRTNVNSSSPSLISCANWYGSTVVQNSPELTSYYGLLTKCMYPLTTTFNYSASATTDRILVASQMGTNQRAIQQGRRQQAITRSQVGQ